MSFVILSLFQIEVFIYFLISTITDKQESPVANLIVSCDLVLLHLILVLSRTSPNSIMHQLPCWTFWTTSISNIWRKCWDFVESVYRRKVPERHLARAAHPNSPWDCLYTCQLKNCDQVDFDFDDSKKIEQKNVCHHHKKTFGRENWKKKVEAEIWIQKLRSKSIQNFWVQEFRKYT